MVLLVLEHAYLNYNVRFSRLISYKIRITSEKYRWLEL